MKLFNTSYKICVRIISNKMQLLEIITNRRAKKRVTIDAILTMKVIIEKKEENKNIY